MHKMKLKMTISRKKKLDTDDCFDGNTYHITVLGWLKKKNKNFKED